MARIICLANSYKHGGRCIAGIDTETGNWIRPVPDTEDRAITPTMMVIGGRQPQILDVIEIPLEDSGPDEGCQPENRLLKPGPWNKIGRITPQGLLRYCEDDSVILHTYKEYVLPSLFAKAPRSKWKSLQLVHNTNVTFVPHGSDPNRWRTYFRDGRGRLLDLKLTDPVISNRLRNNEKISCNCILTLSLATPWSPDGVQPERCYKLVAGVVEL